MPRPGPQTADRFVVLQAADQPVQQHDDRRGQGGQRQQAQERQRRPAPAAQVDAARPARRPAAGVVAPARARDRFHDQDQPHQGHELEAQDGRRRAIEAALHLHEDRPRERVEAQDRDGAEVAHDVQRHQQRPRRQRHPQLGHDHPVERPPGAHAERPRGLLHRGVQAAQPGEQGQQQVGVAEQRQREECALEAGDLRHAVHAQRPQEALQRAPRPRRGQVGERADERREDERQHRQHRPGAAQGDVGAHDQPGGRQRDQDRRPGDADGQQDRVAQ